MIRITSTETRANGNIIEYRVSDTLDFIVTEGKYTGFRCSCSEADMKAGDTCRHIEHITMQREQDAAKQERFLAWQEQQQLEEIAAYVDAMDANAAGHALALVYGHMAQCTVIIGDEAA